MTGDKGIMSLLWEETVPRSGHGGGQERGTHRQGQAQQPHGALGRALGLGELGLVLHGGQEALQPHLGDAVSWRGERPRWPPAPAVTPLTPLWPSCLDPHPRLSPTPTARNGLSCSLPEPCVGWLCSTESGLPPHRLHGAPVAAGGGQQGRSRTGEVEVQKDLVPRHEHFPLSVLHGLQERVNHL